MKRLRISIVINILLLALLASAVYAVREIGELAEQYYFQLNATRLDPLGLQVYPTEATAAVERQPDQQLVVLFGDSRAARWPLPDSTERFVFVNRGIGAQTTAQVQQRYAAHIRPLQPDILLLQVGINDLKVIGIMPHDAQKIIAETQRNIDQIVADATADGATVVIATIFPTGDIPLRRRPFWSAAIEQSVRTVNQHIHSLAAHNVLIFDAYDLLADENGRLPEEAANDELHLSSQGYRLLNKHLFPLLQTITPDA